MKLCTLCNTHPIRKGSASWCAPCSKAYERKRWNALPESERRSKWLKTKYGLTYEQYEKMYKDQDGKCYLCDTEISITSKENGHQTACVDHCHNTGKVRKLLCNHCNRALGLLKENTEVISKMISYLKEYK